jgi:pimeloyl-ACP methyl ester carboxylesterase
MLQFLVSLLLGLSPGLTAGNQLASLDRQVIVAGRSVHIREAGSGHFLVVFEAGMGENLTTWDKVQPEVARFARTLSYDRAGLGKSAQSQVTPRDARQLALELHDLLGVLHESGPTILVGHSLGGAIAQLFAHDHPAKVAGLLLVDPEDGRIDELLASRLPADLLSAREKAIAQSMSTLPAPIKLEKEALPLSGRQAAQALPLPAIPITIMTGTKKNPEFPGNPVEQDVKLELHDQLASQLHASHVLVPQSRHYIQNDAPEMVIAAIRGLVDHGSN